MDKDIIKQELEEAFKLVESEILTDEVKFKIASIFEEEIEKIQKELEEKNSLELKEFKEKIIDDVDKYLEYFVEEFLKENEDKIIEVEKTEKAKKVLNLFSNAVRYFNLNLNEDLDEEIINYKDKIKHLEEENTKLLERCNLLEKEVEELIKEKILDEMEKELETEYKKEKFRKLASKIDTNNLRKFKDSIKEIVETLKSSNESERFKIDENREDNKNENRIKNEKIKEYLKFI